MHFAEEKEVAPRDLTGNSRRKSVQEGCVIWLTGLSAAGKSTIATELQARLRAQGRPVYVLDADVVRRGLCSDLRYSPTDRQENIRRIGEVAALFADAGIICIAAVISPYRSSRAAVRLMAGDRLFIE